MSAYNPLTMIDWSDSFYMYVRARVLAVNPDRLFGGIAQARAWPLKDIQMDTFYLVIGRLSPVASMNSWTAPGFTEDCQWLWQNQGTLATPDNIATNGGDRYVTAYQMIQEMLQGMYPGFFEKQTWAMDENNAFVGTSYPSKEYAWIKKPNFPNKYDADAGILTTSAVTSISSFGPTLTQ